MSKEISTEEAIVYIGVSAGLAGFLAQALSSKRLESLESETISAKSLVLPMGVLIASPVLASRFLPSGQQETVEVERNGESSSSFSVVGER